MKGGSPLRRATTAGGAAGPAAGTRGLRPLDSRWGYAPDPEMLCISVSPAGGTKDFGALLFLMRC